MQCAPDKLSRTIAWFGMCFTTAKCKVLLQGWAMVVQYLFLIGKKLTTVNCFTYLSSCVRRDGSKVSRRM